MTAIIQPKRALRVAVSYVRVEPNSNGRFRWEGLEHLFNDSLVSLELVFSMNVDHCRSLSPSVEHTIPVGLGDDGPTFVELFFSNQGPPIRDDIFGIFSMTVSRFHRSMQLLKIKELVLEDILPLGTCNRVPVTFGQL